MVKKPTYKLVCTQCGKETVVEGIRDPTQSQTTFICEKCNEKNNKARTSK